MGYFDYLVYMREEGKKPPFLTLAFDFPTVIKLAFDFPTVIKLDLIILWGKNVSNLKKNDQFMKS